MKYIIKTILASILVFSSILNASDDYSECITDIYFGNGVWNTYVQALKGRDELKIRLLEKGIIQENEIMKDGQTPLGKKYAFKIAYNWHGMYRNDSGHDEQFKMFFDVAETFVQMKEAGQVSSSSLFKFLEWFVVDRGYPEEFKQQVQVYIDLATTTHMSNVLEMVADYQQYSFDKGHRILLVSHSQGNLWANDMVKAFKPWQREYFRNVGVAVPADHLEAESRYVTLSCDKVMAIIPDHMPANKECYGVEEISGHEFMRSYLRNSNSEHEIFRNAEFYLKILGALDSQWITDQESDKNTCDYKITVKHRYDPSIEMGEKVYPFNASKKLYQVNGEYVKASCGGKTILETWDGKKDDECLMIDNEEKEKIEEEQDKKEEIFCSYSVLNYGDVRNYGNGNGDPEKNYWRQLWCYTTKYKNGKPVGGKNIVIETIEEKGPMLSDYYIYGRFPDGTYRYGLGKDTWTNYKNAVYKILKKDIYEYKKRALVIVNSYNVVGKMTIYERLQAWNIPCFPENLSYYSIAECTGSIRAEILSK